MTDKMGRLSESVERLKIELLAALVERDEAVRNAAKLEDLVSMLCGLITASSWPQTEPPKRGDIVRECSSFSRPTPCSFGQLLSPCDNFTEDGFRISGDGIRILCVAGHEHIWDNASFRKVSSRADHPWWPNAPWTKKEEVGEGGKGVDNE